MKTKASTGARSLIIFLLLMATTACRAVPEMPVDAGVTEIRFSGEQALAAETEFVTMFPDRDSGQPNNRLAADWLWQQFTALGLSCRFDEWEVVNQSEPLPLRNVICELPGTSPRLIIIAAHHDQSPATTYGADNDGSGIVMMLQLAEIFAAEGQPPYTLVFLATDGEEWGMLGSHRYIQTHLDTEQIIAGISLDNVGKALYDGVKMDPTGQFRGMGDLWLQRLSQEASRTVGDLWIPKIYSPLDQVISQAVPISLMDEGPLVAAGVASFGYAGICPLEETEKCWNTYHTPEDTLAYQSAATLFQIGASTEALVRQLLARDAFPQESGPYLYLEESGQVLRGAPLWAIFVLFVALFFAAAGLLARKRAISSGGWRPAVVHFLAIWLPLIAAVLLMYLLVKVGLMDEWHLYPSLAKGDPIFYPRWPAVIIWLLGLALLVWAGRRVGAVQMGPGPAPDRRTVKSLAFLVLALGATYVLLANPFSLILMLPLPLWLLVGRRPGFGRLLDVLLHLMGGIAIIYLFYVFGFVLLRNDMAILWYVMMMFSIGMISFKSALAITAMFAAGLTLLVNPPLTLKRPQ